MKEVVEKLNKQQMKQRLQLLKDFRDKARYDREAQLDYAKEEGHKAGRREGREEGMQKGREEEQTKVILNMLKKRTDIIFISEVTGVSVKEIKKLKNNL